MNEQTSIYNFNPLMINMNELSMLILDKDSNPNETNLSEL